MTIHNSKGMEFPLVYYFDLEAPFSMQAIKDLPLTFDQKIWVYAATKWWFRKFTTALS